jgi:hypothetical protein
MSMLYSVIRIIPPMMTLRRIAYCCAVLFGCMWAALLTQKVYICAHHRAWERLFAPQCHLGESVGIVELISKYSIDHYERTRKHTDDPLLTADLISDGILVLLPLRLLWRVNMPRHMRRLLFSIFSASILVTVVSIVHAVYLLGPSGLLEGLTANVEVCNLFFSMTCRGLTDDTVCCVIDSRQPCGGRDTHISSHQKRRRRGSRIVRRISHTYNTLGPRWSQKLLIRQANPLQIARQLNALL